MAGTSRNTVAKTEILNLINQADKALSHTEIQSSLPVICDRVTIYRVLDRLTEEGLIHRIVNIDGVIKYAGCHHCHTEHRHNHIHFSCEKCKSVTCLDHVEPAFSLPGNYTVYSVNFTVSGLCPQCS